MLMTIPSRYRDESAVALCILEKYSAKRAQYFPMLYMQTFTPYDVINPITIICSFQHPSTLKLLPSTDQQSSSS